MSYPDFDPDANHTPPQPGEKLGGVDASPSTVLREQLDADLQKVFDSAMAHKDHPSALAALRDRAQLGHLL